MNFMNNRLKDQDKVKPKCLYNDTITKMRDHIKCIEMMIKGLIGMLQDYNQKQQSYHKKGRKNYMMKCFLGRLKFFAPQGIGIHYHNEIRIYVQRSGANGVERKKNVQRQGLASG